MDSGILVVKSDSSVDTASGSEVLFNTTDPFMKLDSINPVSFQNINITLAVDPPNPDGTILTEKIDTIYTFKHGYTYKPAAWFLIQAPVQTSVFPGFGYEGAVIRANGIANMAIFQVAINDTSVSLQIKKLYNPAIDPTSPVDLTGYLLKIRSYIFVEDIGA